MTNISSLPPDEPPQFTLLEELRSKSSCVSILCLCLRNVPTITAMVRAEPPVVTQQVKGLVSSLSHPLSLSPPPQPPHLLPAPPDAVVAAVLWLLRISSGDGVTSNGRTEVFKNIVGSSKVQKCALEALTAFSCSPGRTSCSMTSLKSGCSQSGQQGLPRWG